MPSETDLMNDALGQIGQGRITSIDDGSIAANRCLDFYPALRDGLLRCHFWNFAIQRVQLAQNVTGPLFGFAYSWALPSDFLRLKEYAGGSPTYMVPVNYWLWDMPLSQYFKIEGRNLFSNDSIAYIAYIKRITNPDLWDPSFYQVVSTELASKLALALAKDAKLSRSLLETAEQILLPSAMSIDGQEGSIERNVVDDLTWGR